MKQIAESSLMLYNEVANWRCYPSDKLRNGIPVSFCVSWDDRPETHHFDWVLSSDGKYRWGGACCNIGKRVSYDHYREFEVCVLVSGGVIDSKAGELILKLRRELLPDSRALNNDDLLVYGRNHKRIGRRLCHVGNRGLYDGKCFCRYTFLPKGDYFEEFFDWTDLNQTTPRWVYDDDTCCVVRRSPLYLHAEDEFFAWKRRSNVVRITDSGLVAARRFFNLINKVSWLNRQ